MTYVLQPGGSDGAMRLRRQERRVTGEGGQEAVIPVDPESPASAAVARRAGFIPVPGEEGTRFDRYVRGLRVVPEVP
jgi:hypothetical protein